MAIDRNKITKLAENYMAVGKIERAIDEFMKLIEDRPDDFQLLNRVGDAYLQAGKMAEGIDLFKRAGAGFERGGFNSKATAVLKKAHRIAPDDLDIAERLAELYRQTNLIKDAIQIHIEVADLFTKKGLIKRALEEFAKVVDLDPKNLKNKVKLADLYNKEGMKDRAANIYLEVAEALALDQMHSEANQILDRAKTMVSTPQVFLTQARLCVIQKDLAAAAGHLREGLGSNPRSQDLLEALAEVELQARRPEGALDALAQLPQMPEKALALCERALRELAQGGRTAEALEGFKPIGRSLARRGLGEGAARVLRSALQGSLNAEAWIQLADIAHQSGNRAEQVDCLRHAHAQAGTEGDDSLVATLARQLQGLGVTGEQLSAPLSVPSAPRPQAPAPQAVPQPPEAGDVDPVVRMQIEQLMRDGEHALRSRFMDRALECYGKALDLDPLQFQAIHAIADIHRASGVLTKVQMHYVKSAEKVAGLGRRHEASELLDRAETLFPGSTRLYRRNLGLMDLPPAPAPVPAAPPRPLAPPPVPEMPSLDALPLIELDDSPRGAWSAPAAPTPRAEPSPEDTLVRPLEALPREAPLSAESFDLPVWDELQALPEPAGPSDPWAELTGEMEEPSPAKPVAPEPFGLPESLSPLELPDSFPEILSEELPELSEAPSGAPPEPLQALPPLELEPLPFPTSAPVIAEVDENLESILSDIDFQLDYGSPEEAKLEIERALGNYPGHPELTRRLEQAAESLRRLGFSAAPKTAEPADFSPSFFDLTDVLSDALLETGDGEEMHDATHMVEKIQTVDELFNAFREGVEQQVKGDDYDTHYNLGIAYKEMLLLEPAMEEFKKAMADPERTLECCSMLAICEESQGNTDLAIQWLRQGIHAPGFPPEDAIGLHYDLGVLLEQKGMLAEAREQFHQVHGLDPDYREVASRLG